MRLMVGVLVLEWRGLYGGYTEMLLGIVLQQYLCRGSFPALWSEAACCTRYLRKCCNWGGRDRVPFIQDMIIISVQLQFFQ